MGVAVKSVEAKVNTIQPPNTTVRHAHVSALSPRLFRVLHAMICARRTVPAQIEKSRMGMEYDEEGERLWDSPEKRQGGLGQPSLYSIRSCKQVLTCCVVNVTCDP